MAKIQPFEEFTDHYENWFERNFYLYLSEVNCLKRFLKGESSYKSLEVGVGSGRFAHPLGIRYGLDPSPSMLKIALRRGIKGVLGVAESLPFKSFTFDWVLMVTTLCFLDDPPTAFKEIERVLTQRGKLLLGFVDKNSPLGRLYEAKRERSKFYREATFFSPQEVIETIEGNTRLKFIQAKQTVFGKENKLYPTLEGFGKGSFVCLLFKRK
jgi:ubiquinone/menaquinone biosynthesis C-methylase UbiE